ncbi:hypothetical protein MATL_G00173480 [Megalops atlanticus]|uniref:Uncharacterized protein n=1 Tax=Megalops atlanticus TaxID=7932 RepID=A0A9D3T0X0_MEGAT|nr:hypothetical protein MATL_G00173480 [Megalops atlanticus]
MPLNLTTETYREKQVQVHRGDPASQKGLSHSPEVSAGKARPGEAEGSPRGLGHTNVFVRGAEMIQGRNLSAIWVHQVNKVHELLD